MANRNELFAELEDARDRLSRAETAVIRETKSRDSLITRLAAMGVGSLQIAFDAGITERRVQQIVRRAKGLDHLRADAHRRNISLS